MNIYELTGLYKTLEVAVALNPDEEELAAEFEKINEEGNDSYSIIFNI